jgi:ubiquinone/menaquinone biosynthesis C-methylase UbiE
VNLSTGRLLSLNLRINGPKAILLSVGLGKSEFVEFSRALSLIDGENARLMLDVGCGHSLWPSLSRIEVAVIDLTEESLRWQLEISGKTINPVRASATNLPFREDTFPVVTAISSLEHIPMNGDGIASAEIMRTMKRRGLGVISVPGLPPEGSKTKTRTGLTTGIPSWARFFLRGAVLRAVFSILQVDRTETYSERIYNAKDIRIRLLPQGCTEVRADAYSMSRELRRIINKIYPYGLLTPVDMFLARRFRFVGDMLLSSDCRGSLVVISFRKP